MMFNTLHTNTHHLKWIHTLIDRTIPHFLLSIRGKFIFRWILFHSNRETVEKNDLHGDFYFSYLRHTQLFTQKLFSLPFCSITHNFRQFRVLIFTENHFWPHNSFMASLHVDRPLYYQIKLKKIFSWGSQRQYCYSVKTINQLDNK